MKKLFTFLTACLIFGSINAQVNYYVSNTGDDTNGDGSQGNPWATLLKACDAAVAEGSASEYNIYIMGDVLCGGTSTLKFKRTVTVNIKGSGAATSAILGVADADYASNQNPGRIFQFNSNDNEGLTLNIEDLSLRNFGFENTNGGGLLNVISDVIVMHISVKRCNIENGKARNGALIQLKLQKGSFTMDSCYVTNMKSIMNNDITSPLVLKGGNVSISNCAFTNCTNDISANYGTVVQNNSDGSVITLETLTAVTANISNNIFINNNTTKYGNDTEPTATQSVVSIINNSAQTSLALTFNDNYMINNGKTGSTTNFVDFYIDPAATSATITEASNNIMNSADDDFPTVGNTIDAGLIYTSNVVNFDMDGSDPKVYTTSKGLKYLVANGISTKIMRENKNTVSIFQTSGKLFVKGEVKSVKVFNVSGVMVSQNNVPSSEVQLNIDSKGLYIVVAEMNDGKKECRKIIMN